MKKIWKLIFGTTLATGVATHLMRNRSQILGHFQTIYSGHYEMIHPKTGKIILIHITQKLKFLINHKQVDGEVIEINEQHLLFQDTLGFQIEILTQNNQAHTFIDEADRVKMVMKKI
ncbi:MAG: DUF4828 domain-containing protein [Streptococcaceae bacterium]|jgi:hypothetical protein|nr:DUF4828 domain-containing protein [Streptococcaceae bacterium]